MGYPGSSTALSFEKLQAIDMSFNRSSTVGQCQPCYDSCLVTFQSMGKLPELSGSRCLDALQPGLQLGSLKRADQDEKLLNQQLAMSDFTIGMANERQELLCLAGPFFNRRA